MTMAGNSRTPLLDPTANGESVRFGGIASLPSATSDGQGLTTRRARRLGKAGREVGRRLARAGRSGSRFVHENRWILLVVALLIFPAWIKSINLLLLLALLVLAMWGVNWVIAGWQVRRVTGKRVWHGPI